MSLHIHLYHSIFALPLLLVAVLAFQQPVDQPGKVEITSAQAGNTQLLLPMIMGPACARRGRSGIRC